MVKLLVKKGKEMLPMIRASSVGDEKYILNLILKVITVSLETNKIVKSLPKLNIHQLDR